MDRRSFIGSLSAATIMAKPALAATSGAANIRSKGVMLMNRIAPSRSELFIANLDGSGERKFLADTQYEYNASFAPRGGTVIFTSERNGDGQSDLFRANADGTGITQLAAGAPVDDAGVLSPDGTRLAFVSTRNGYRANIWVMDVRSGHATQLTGTGTVHGAVGLPDGYFRPSWSLDGKWIAFSSDRDTPWRGHNAGAGWEHTQELSIYVIGADGKGFRRVATKTDHCLGSPKWSPDGKHITFYDMTTEDTWGARRPEYFGKAMGQIASVELATDEWTTHTSGPGLKLQPQFISNDEIGYLMKNGPNEGLFYTSSRAPVKMASVRSPNWSPDGKSVIYERTAFRPVRPMFKPLYSWDKDFEYRHIDVFPQISRDGWIVYTEKQTGKGSIVIMRPDGSGKTTVFSAEGRGLDPELVNKGLAGAFFPGWSPDNQWITFGLGYWFGMRANAKASIWRIRRDGTALEQLTDGSIHSGFPSFSADGKEIVYRVWSEAEKGLRILNLETRQTRILTQGFDNIPVWSPDGQSIVFTRKRDDGNFDIYTIKPDGSGLFRCTTHPSSDGHAVWTQDGRILWSGSEQGFRDEAALYDNTFQQYGQIWIMNADGSGKRMLTDSKWEDSMPLYLPNGSALTAG
jgi:Tol biopolymer transport system component